MSGFGYKLDALEKSAKRGLALVGFWRQRIADLGDEKAEALAKVIHSQGHVHVERKSIDWNGLSVSRQPTELEQLFDLKGMAATFEAEQATMSGILKQIRSELIAEAVKKLAKTDSADLHTLVLDVPKDAVKDVRAALSATFAKGQAQVADELNRQKPPAKALFITGIKSSIDPNDVVELDDLADRTVSRLINQIQALAAEFDAQLRTVGYIDEELAQRLRDALDEMSDAPLERFAREAANRALSDGRSAEGAARSDEWDRAEYSALLDANTCSPCEEADGQSAATEDELPDAPNPECEGQGQCRCFHVFVSKDEGTEI